jgi:hypothetical protein
MAIAGEGDAATSVVDDSGDDECDELRIEETTELLQRRPHAASTAARASPSAKRRYESFS